MIWSLSVVTQVLLSGDCFVASTFSRIGTLYRLLAVQEQLYNLLPAAEIEYESSNTVGIRQH